MYNVLSQIDLYAVHFIPTINGHKHHKTLLGGLLSILICSISFAYFLFILIQWQSGQFAPKVTQMQKNFKYKTFEESDLIEVRLTNFQKLRDPFTTKNNILTPLVIHFTLEKQFSDIEPLFDQISGYHDDLHTRMITIKHKLVQNTDNNINEEQIYNPIFLLAPCQEKYLPQDGYCASDEEIQDYLKLPQFLDINFKLKQFNPLTNQVEVYDKMIYQMLDHKSVLYNEILLKPTEVHLNEGFIFHHESIVEFLGDSSINTQNVSFEYINQLLQMNLVCQILIRLDYVEDIMSVYYLRLGEILAEIGSITSALFSLQFFIIFFNEKSLEKEILDNIFKMYFPSNKKLKIQKNWFGQALKVEDQQKIQYDPKQYEDFRHKMSRILYKKLDFMNLTKKQFKYKQLQNYYSRKRIFRKLPNKGQIFLNIYKSREISYKYKLRKIFRIIQQSVRERIIKSQDLFLNWKKEIKAKIRLLILKPQKQTIFSNGVEKNDIFKQKKNIYYHYYFILSYKFYVKQITQYTIEIFKINQLHIYMQIQYS